MSEGRVVSDPKVFGENLRLLMCGITARGKVTARELSKATGYAPSTFTKILNGETKRPEIELQQKVAEYFNVRIMDLWTKGIYSDGVFDNINFIGAFGDPVKRPVYDNFRNGAVDNPAMTFATFSGAEVGWLANRDMPFSIKFGDIVVFDTKYRENDLCIANYKDEVYIGYLNFIELRDAHIGVIIRGTRGEIIVQAKDEIRVLGRVTEVRHVFPKQPEPEE